MEKRLSRRNFLAGTLALGAATATGGLLAGCSSTGGAQTQNDASGSAREWFEETDVVVVGSGFAALAAAHEAAKAGATVRVLEKAPEEDAGGNSRACAQAVWAPQDTDDAISYFKDLCGTYHLADMEDDMIRVFVEGAAENADWLLDEFDIEAQMMNITEYPNAETALKNPEVGTSFFSKEGAGQEHIWRPMLDMVTENEHIAISYETPFTDLIFNDEGEVIGIEALIDGKIASVKARKGVVLALGGFEYNQTLMADFARYPNEGWSWGTPYNTGDGIVACMKHDIAFWHMTSTTNACRLGVVADWLDERLNKSVIDIEVVQSGEYGCIWTDKYGKRFMDESRSYQHGYGRDAIFYNDGNKLEWPRIPLWQVVDEAALPKMGSFVCGWMGVVGGMTHDQAMDELTAQGLLLKADTIDDLASQMGVDPASLSAEVEAFNAAAGSGTSDAFGRAAEKMRALEAPFYAIKSYPVMVNTNGGPRRNAEANIVKVDKTPVPRLYSSGEFGSIWPWYYQGAGNVSECMVFGRIAGRNAAALEAWDAE